MVETDKNIKAKLQIIREMASEQSVKQLADVVIEYIESNSKSKIGFKDNK